MMMSERFFSFSEGVVISAASVFNSDVVSGCVTSREICSVFVGTTSGGSCDDDGLVTSIGFCLVSVFSVALVSCGTGFCSGDFGSTLAGACTGFASSTAA